MKQFEYIQILRAAHEVQSKINLSDEDLVMLDMLRKLHKKYQDELEQWLIYPNYNIFDKFKKARLTVDDIVEFCKQYEIRYVFSKIPTDSWTNFRARFDKTRDFCRYYIEDVEVTKLVCFSKPPKEDKDIDIEMGDREIEDLEL